MKIQPENIPYPDPEKFQPVSEENPFSHVPKPVNSPEQQRVVGNAALAFGIGDELSNQQIEHTETIPQQTNKNDVKPDEHEFSHPHVNIPTPRATDEAPSLTFKS